MFRYLSLTTACDLTFVIFLLAWLFSRQIGLALVIRTCALDAPKYIPFNWDPKNGMYLTQATYYGFIGMLCVLWTLASIWFYMALMVAVRVVRGLGAEDSRSDDEGGDEDEVEAREEIDDVKESACVTGGKGMGDVRKRR